MYEQDPTTLMLKYSCDNCRWEKEGIKGEHCSKCFPPRKIGEEDKFPKWEKKI